MLHSKRDPEIRNDRVRTLQQDVFWLDVAVNDAGSVCCTQRIGDFACDRDSVTDRQLSFPLEPCTERFTRDVWHDVVKQSVGIAGVEEWQDVRMLQTSGRANLGEESLASQRGTEIGMENFDRYVAAVPEIVREVYRRHPTLAKLTLDSVLVGECAG